MTRAQCATHLSSNRTLHQIVSNWTSTGAAIFKPPASSVVIKTHTHTQQYRYTLLGLPKNAFGPVNWVAFRCCKRNALSLRVTSTRIVSFAVNAQTIQLVHTPNSRKEQCYVWGQSVFMQLSKVSFCQCATFSQVLKSVFVLASRWRCI